MTWAPQPGDQVLLVFADPIQSDGAHVILNFDRLSIQSNATLDAITDDATGVLLATNLPVAFAAIDAATDDAVGAFLVVQPVTAVLAATTDDVEASFAASYDVNVYRGPNRQTGMATTDSLPVRPQWRSEWQDIGMVPALASTKWRDADFVEASVETGWRVPAAIAAAVRPRFTDSPLRAAAVLGAWHIPHSLALEVRLDWSPADPVRRAGRIVYFAAPVQDPVWVVAWARVRTARAGATVPFGSGDPLERTLSAAFPWRDGYNHPWVFGWSAIPDPPQPPITPGPVYLRFRCPPQPGPFYQLRFGVSDCWWLHPVIIYDIEGTLIVQNNLSVTRLSDGTPIDVISLSMSLDTGSWSWGFTLQLDGPAALDAVTPIGGDPVAVSINLNGYLWTMLVESFGRNRVFGKIAYTATGRSLAAQFADPVSAIRTYTEDSVRTADQLIRQEVSRDDPGAAWSVVYYSNSIRDLSALMGTWTVPAGAFSYQNKSAIDAIAQVVSAIGARVYSDRADYILRIAPNYTYSPWEWATAAPDVTINQSAVSAIQTDLKPKPIYTQVLVAGQAGGVGVNAQRSGSASWISAPMVTDPLITHTVAATERARIILSDVGKQATVSLTLPLTADFGVIEPGRLVEIQEESTWRGLVTGVTVTAKFPEVTQTIEVERHYG